MKLYLMRKLLNSLDEYRKNPNLAEEKPIRVARFPKVA